MAGVDRSNSSAYYPCVHELHGQIYTKYGMPTVVVSANPLKTDYNKKAREIERHLGLNKGGVIYFPGEFGASSKLLKGNYTAMASVKAKRIREEVAKIRGELGERYRAIWIGDNGQGDLIAAEELLHDNIIHVALIHYVDPNKPSGKES